MTCWSYSRSTSLPVILLTLTGVKLKKLSQRGFKTRQCCWFITSNHSITSKPGRSHLLRKTWFSKSLTSCKFHLTTVRCTTGWICNALNWALLILSLQKGMNKDSFLSTHSLRRVCQGHSNSQFPTTSTLSYYSLLNCLKTVYYWLVMSKEWARSSQS